MWRPSKLTGVLVVAATTIGIYALADERGQTSPEEQISAEEQGFRSALEGDFSQVPQEGIYGDIIGVIKQQGSILDNTSFDPRADVEAASHSRELKSKKAYAAEQLLKASRWLESLGAGNREQADLVNRMRAEAVKLLSE